ncbi:MAG: S8 family serine peptidase [Chthoniobacterales bacterium]|nr:S8 family serine peptidase [Chthoniobacterales bacterium]
MIKQVEPKLVQNRKTRIIALTGALFAGVLSSPLSATPIPQNLGNGLRSLVQKQTSAATVSSFLDYEKLKITDAQDRVLVDIMLSGTVPLTTMRSRITALGNNRITISKANYRKGVIEAFVSLAQAPGIAKMKGVSAVHLVPKPVADIGLATTQGIEQHRIDQLDPSINGKGITTGVLSDSYNSSGGPITAQDDISTGDLPGPGNPFGNTAPVLVLEDLTAGTGTDEGRAMLQIVHDIAPKSKLGFATADLGEVDFADNILSLAGLPTGSKSRPHFQADVIIDDIIYLDEPMFQDGIVAQAADEVAAAGVSYFSSAGNRPASQGYDSDFRLVPPGPGATDGTNIDLTGVDPSLYAGGFQNFSTNSEKQDIAQDTSVVTAGTIVFQWNEPFDTTPPTIGALLQSGSGTLTEAMPTEDFPFQGTAGQRIAIIADAAPGSPNPLPDVTITLIDPNGNQIAFQDATTDPETLVTFLPVTGTYTIRIGGFEGATGDFVYEVHEASGSQLVQTDYNLLFFDPAGHFLFSVAENNLATNRPLELATITGTFDLQLVIARANTPGPGAANHLKYVWFNGGLPKEYVSYTTPVTFGHNSANGASGVAAYAFYKPYVPESFTSPGPATIYFDKDNNPLPKPEVRRKPDMAAMDGANTTFFVADATQDKDKLPNFFGTSAAAPHAGGIATLMLQAAGGPHSLLPEDLRRTMQKSAFRHDLDGSRAVAVANNGGERVSIVAIGDGTNTSSQDPNFFQVRYTGGSSLTSLTLDVSNADTTEIPQGLVFDTRDITLGGFPFTLGRLKGVDAGAINATFSEPAPLPAVEGQFQQLTLSIDSGAISSGDEIHFGVDRDEADAFGPNGAVGGNSADLLGAEVRIPQGTVAPGGATFSASLANGTVLRGTFTNTLGNGYSFLDGFGFVNAEAAIKLLQNP